MVSFFNLSISQTVQVLLALERIEQDEELSFEVVIMEFLCSLAFLGSNMFT